MYFSSVRDAEREVNAATRSQDARGTLRQACLRVVVFGVLLGLVASSGWAAETGKKDAKEQETVVSKIVTGEVVWVGKWALSIEVNRTEESSTDMLIPYDKKTKLERLKELAQLRRGDTVQIECEQRYTKDEKGEPVLSGTMAKKVSLVRQAVSGALQSNQAVSR
jgi:hypothetical protein